MLQGPEMPQEALRRPNTPEAPQDVLRHPGTSSGACWSLMTIVNES